MRAILITGTCVLMAAAQLLLRAGMQRVGAQELSVAGVLRALSQWQVALSLVCLLAGWALWAALLVKGQVSYAYPLLAYSVLPVVLGGWWLLSETLTVGKVIGPLLMIIGAIVMMRSGQP